MSLKDRVKQSLAVMNNEPQFAGFQLQTPIAIQFGSNIDQLLHALKDQTENTAMIDGHHMGSRIGMHGEVEDTEWFLSNAAFGDLCHWAKVPVSFAKRLAHVNEELASEVMYAMIEAVFHREPAKVLVIDTTTGRIDGIVSKDVYKPIANLDIVEWARSAMPGLAVSESWLSGPNLRVTCVSEKLKVEPVKGDVVKFGTSLENAIHGDCSARVCDYNLRLVCTNGMTARDGKHMEVIRHVGDAEFEVQKAIVKSAQRAEAIAPMLVQAASRLLTPNEVRAVKRFVADPKNGGSPKLDHQATQVAMVEAVKEGRDEDEVTLWNFVNGITQIAKEPKSVHRMVELEGLAFKTLRANLAKYGYKMAGKVN
jgi:hypothetical protein